LSSSLHSLSLLLWNTLSSEVVRTGGRFGRSRLRD
jgi:hypothetical protein